MEKTYEVMRETMFHLIVCSNYRPEEKHLLDLKVNQENTAGTSGGWQLKEATEPIQCESKEGFWHYVFAC